MAEKNVPMILSYIALGLAAGLVEQIASLPINYYEYRRIAHDDIKCRQFYKTAAIEFLIAELFFVGVAMFFVLLAKLWP